MRIILLALLPFFTVTSCLKDEPFKQAYGGYTPYDLGDGWEISDPEAENITNENIEKAYRLLYQDDRFWMARSLLVVRNGKLVAEAYPHDLSDRDKYANIQSCTKTFTSIMVGIAIQNGIALSPEDRLYGIYPDLFDDDEAKQHITVDNALTMRTGLEFNNSVHTLQLYQTLENSAAFVLDFPVIEVPGTVFNYNDGAPQLISKAIETKAGKSQAEYAREKLFEPLNITNWQWESAHDGTTYGAFSLYMVPRDFIKTGQLLLQNGRWSDQQIIDSVYLARATSVKVDSAYDSAYGYYFWIDQRNRGYYALGHGGQILLVVPEKELVLLYTAWPYTSGDYFDDGFEMLNLIVDGCR